MRSRHFGVSDPKHCVCLRCLNDRLDQSERLYVDHKSKCHIHSANHLRNSHSLKPSQPKVDLELYQVRKLNTFLGLWVTAAAAVLAVYVGCQVVCLLTFLLQGSHLTIIFPNVFKPHLRLSWQFSYLRLLLA